jgi:hypothetical protein
VIVDSNEIGRDIIPTCNIHDEFPVNVDRTTTKTPARS